MTLYLLVVEEEGDVSYSLWKTLSSAKCEAKYLKDYQFVDFENITIVEVDTHD